MHSFTTLWHSSHVDVRYDLLPVCLQGAQLLELVKLLPASATEQIVQLCSKFWARLTDRAKTWSDVMRALTTEQQVRAAVTFSCVCVQCT